MIRADLINLFSYDIATGVLSYKRTGKEAGFVNGNRHKTRSVKIKGKCYYTHRLIWLLVYGDEPEVIDHINGNPLDNRLQNLRVHPTHNQHNRRENRHLPEPLRVNGKWTETGKAIQREFKRTGQWNPGRL